MSLMEKLEKVLMAKQVIKQAIINRGVEISNSDTFISYADKINSIKTTDVDFIETGKIISI